MSDSELALRDLLHRAPPEAPPFDPRILSGRHPSTAPLRLRRRQRWTACALAAAAVVTLAVLATDLGGSSPTTTPGRQFAPAGDRRVVYHGLTIDVPAAWGYGPVSCSAPTRDWVAPTEDVAPMCGQESSASRASQQQQHHVLVSLLPAAHARPSNTSTPVVQTVTVDGVSATRETVDTGNGQNTFLLTVPSIGATVKITGATATRADTILDTVHLAGTSFLGCPTKTNTMLPAVAGTSGSLTSAQTASAGVTCVYSPDEQPRGTDWLVGRAPLTLTQLAALKAAVRSATHAAAFPGTGQTLFAWYRLALAGGKEITIAATLNTTPSQISDGKEYANLATALDLPVPWS